MKAGKTKLLIDKNPPVISIVISNFKSTIALERCLSSVIRCTQYPNYEIIVVDILTPQIKRYIRSKFPNVKVVHLDTDIGASETYNVGLQVANKASKYLVFLDDDVIVTSGWLENLVRVIESDESIGLASSLLLQLDERLTKLDMVQQITSVVDEFGRRFEIGYGLQPKTLSLRTGENIFGLLGPAFITRKQLFSTVGGYDSRFHIGLDDLEYSFRLLARNHRVVCATDSIVYHARGTWRARHLSPRGKKKTKAKGLFHSIKNSNLLLIKYNKSCLSMIFGLAIKTLFSLRDFVIHFLKWRYHDKELAYSHLSAVMWTMTNFGCLLRERWELWPGQRNIVFLKSWRLRLNQLGLLLFPFLYARLHKYAELEVLRLLKNYAKNIQWISLMDNRNVIHR